MHSTVLLLTLLVFSSVMGKQDKKVPDAAVF